MKNMPRKMDEGMPQKLIVGLYAGCIRATKNGQGMPRKMDKVLYIGSSCALKNEWK